MSFKLKPFWVQIRGGETRTLRAHEADRTETDLVFVNTPAGGLAGAGGTVVARFPLSMVDSWGEGAAPSSLVSFLWGVARPKRAM